jgi:hypothetical protein
MFDRAAFCFQRANSPGLRSIALINSQVIQARAQMSAEDSHALLSGGQSKAPWRELSVVEEVQTAGLVARCVRAGLRREARELCALVAPVLAAPSQGFFASEVLSSL